MLAGLQDLAEQLEAEKTKAADLTQQLEESNKKLDCTKSKLEATEEISTSAKGDVEVLRKQVDELTKDLEASKKLRTEGLKRKEQVDDLKAQCQALEAEVKRVTDAKDVATRKMSGVLDKHAVCSTRMRVALCCCVVGASARVCVMYVRVRVVCV